MRFSRNLLSWLDPFTSPGRGKSTSAFLGLALAVAMAVAAAPVGGTAYAHSGTSGLQSAASAQATTPFLTLPFAPTASMSILGGWYYSGGGGFHGGIDYINGNVNGYGSWKTFPVIASADGEACGNCSSRQGNAVWVKHKVNGATYYTYYGHLASIAEGIPVGSQSRTVAVKRGQLLGMAGDTGTSGALHLHFALYNSSSQPLDPYGIYNLRQHYPSPSQGSPGIGWFITDQPTQNTEQPQPQPQTAPAPETNPAAPLMPLRGKM